MLINKNCLKHISQLQSKDVRVDNLVTDVLRNIYYQVRKDNGRKERMDVERPWKELAAWKYIV